MRYSCVGRSTCIVCFINEPFSAEDREPSLILKGDKFAYFMLKENEARFDLAEKSYGERS